MEKKKIHVFNWYTADKNPVFSFDGHPQPIKEIDWFENDLGFTTCAADGAVFFWDLYNYSAEKKPEELKRHQDADFNVKNVAFTSVVNVPGRQYQVYVVGNDKKIHSNLKVKKEGVLGETTDEQHLSVPTLVS
jgi:WD40 repeat protein